MRKKYSTGYFGSNAKFLTIPKVWYWLVAIHIPLHLCCWSQRWS